MAFQDEDEALVAAALTGSTPAWDRLVRRYESRIYNYGLRLTGSSSDAMDLTQDVFLGVFRNLHRFRGDARFSSWIFRIAHNKAIDLNRRKRLLQGSVSSHEDDQHGDSRLVDPDRNAEPDHRFAQAQQNRQIQRLLHKLPMQQRLIVELKIYQSMTFEEIALAQEISENTAKTRFYTALRKLKNSLEDSHVMSQDRAPVNPVL
jgi:RNA polymerase sigma-70 factor (ECF subfamily)